MHATCYSEEIEDINLDILETDQALGLHLQLLPIEKANVILITLFVSGVITLLQSLTLLPIVMGSSFSYVIPAMTISQNLHFCRPLKM